MRIVMLLGALFLVAAVCIFAWGKYESHRIVRTQVDALINKPHSTIPAVDFKRQLASLPRPVQDYFRFALKDGQNPIRLARLRQKGQLRVTPRTEKWLPFDATEFTAPSQHGFLWDAQVSIFPGLSLQVLDSYASGVGSGEIRLFSAFRVGHESGGIEMNSGALYRYLAEAAWFPTALLPQAGVHWSAIDDSRALATLTDGDTEVSLEIRFNPKGELISIFTPGRWGNFRGGFKKLPWEGRFARYVEISGMKIPTEGEVGWYLDGEWKSVWKGEVVEAKYDF